jgi:hypothetical protein
MFCAQSPQEHLIFCVLTDLLSIILFLTSLSTLSCLHVESFLRQQPDGSTCTPLSHAMKNKKKLMPCTVESFSRHQPDGGTCKPLSILHYGEPKSLRLGAPRRKPQGRNLFQGNSQTAAHVVSQYSSISHYGMVNQKAYTLVPQGGPWLVGMNGACAFKTLHMMESHFAGVKLLGAWQGTLVFSVEKDQPLWLVKRRSEKHLYQVYEGISYLSYGHLATTVLRQS